MKKQVYSMVWMMSFFGFVQTTFAQKAKEISQAVYFEKGSYALSADAKNDLAAILKEVGAAGDYNIDIVAFADADGNETANQKLSENRAQTVAQFLLEKGIASQKSTATGRGEVGEEQAAVNEKAKNRRVDIKAVLYQFDQVSDIWTLMRQKNKTEQSFTIEGNQAQTIVGAKGTKLVIPPATLVFADGSQPKGKIEVRLQEAYQYSDMLMQGLTTLSNGNLLETGGMFKVEAFADGKPLQVRAGKAIQVEMATEQKAGMQLFYADPVANNAPPTNWQPTFIPMTKGTNPVSVEDWKKMNVGASFGKMPIFPVEPPEFKQKQPEEPNWRDLPEKFKITKKMSKREKRRIKKLRAEGTEFKEYVQRKAEERSKYPALLEKYKADRDTANAEMLRYGAKYKNFEKEFKARCEPVYKFMEEYTSSRAIYSFENPTDTSKIDMEKIAEKLFEEIFTKDEIENLPPDFKKMIKQYHTHRQLESYAPSYGVRGRCGDGSIGFNLLDWNQVYAAKKSNIEATYQNGYNQTMTSIVQLGWINCDRFGGETDLIVVKVSKDIKAGRYVVCKSIKSLMNVSQMEKGYDGVKVPKGMDIAIIGIKLEDGKPQFARIDTKAGSQEEYNLSYQPCTVKELEAQLRNL